MKRFKRWLFLLVPALLSCTALNLNADVIYFKDGNVLVVEKAWIDGDVVKYQTSRGVQSLSGALVRQIKQENPVLPASPQKWSLGVVVSAAPNAPGSGSTDSAELTKEALKRLRDNLNFTPSDLRARAELIYALNSVASLQLAQGDFPNAQRSLEEALGLDRRNPVILSNLAVVHLRMGNYSTAEDLLRSSLEIDRSNADVYFLLGESYYREDKIADAIDQWNAGLRLGPHAEMTKRLDKAQQEVAAQNQMGVLQSSHFLLRYDRKVSDSQLGQQMLSTLEGHYSQLTRDLISRPPATIVVILYPDQAYFNITRAATWSGALYDGKIRIPTRGLTSVTPELSAILIHELTHSFIDSLPGHDCPAWFNEGVAQLEEGSTSATDRKLLAELRQANLIIPLRDLAGTFSGFPVAKADLAYTESLSAVEYIVTQFGRDAIRSILNLMAQNYNFENAFKSALGRSVSEFQTAWQQNLTQ